MGRIVGIDLGTTNSVVAVVDHGRPKVLTSRNRKPVTRSAVGLAKVVGQKCSSEKGMLIGEAALKNWPKAPQDTIVSVKRLMGRGVADKEVQKVREWVDYRIIEPVDGTKDSIRILIGGQEYSPVDISSMILRWLKEQAEIRLQEEVTHALITVPAYFSQIQRAATRRAGLMAGLKIIKILDEPTAAAIAYGIDIKAGPIPKNLLVYDLGGGTFDISLLMWAGGVFVPLVLEGDMWLGGDDFDRLLVDHVLKHIRQKYGLDPSLDKALLVSLKGAAQKVKEQLSSAELADFVVDDVLSDAAGNVINIRLEITREEFEQMISPLVDRTIHLVNKAIKNSPLTSCDEIDYVLMVGNSTYIPMIRRAVGDLFGIDKIRQDIHPKHCVAIGAAILANRLRGTVCQAENSLDETRECGHVNDLEAAVCEKCGAPLAQMDGAETKKKTPYDKLSPPIGIAPFAYGTQTAGDVFNVFVNKGDPYPTGNPQPQTFYTSHPNQRMTSIPVYGGDNLEKASANQKQGEAFTVLPPNLPKGTVVRVTLWLDSDGCFRVAAHLDDGTDLDPWITEGGEDAKAIEAIQKAREKVVQEESLHSMEEVMEIESITKDVLDKLKEHDFTDALSLARKAEDLADRRSRDETLTEKVNRLIWYAEHVVQNYSWAMDSKITLALTGLASETRTALMAEKKDVLEDKAHKLDKLLDDVPQTVKVLVGLKIAIFEQIHPVDPVRARDFLNEIEAIEHTLASSDTAEDQKLDDVADRIWKSMCELEKTSPMATECSVCGTRLHTERFCLNCGHDQFILISKRRYPSSDIVGG